MVATCSSSPTLASARPSSPPTSAADHGGNRLPWPHRQAIVKAEQREQRPVALDGIADQFLRDLSPVTVPIAVVRERNDAGLEHFELKRTSGLTVAEKTKVKCEVKISLLRHICFSTKQRSTMPGLGLAALSFDMPEDLVDTLCAQLPLLSARGKDFTKQLLKSLLTLMVQRAAVDPPEMITVGNVLRYGSQTRRKRPHFILPTLVELIAAW